MSSLNRYRNPPSQLTDRRIPVNHLKNKQSPKTSVLEFRMFPRSKLLLFFNILTRSTAHKLQRLLPFMQRPSFFSGIPLRLRVEFFRFSGLTCGQVKNVAHHLSGILNWDLYLERNYLKVFQEHPIYLRMLLLLMITLLHWRLLMVLLALVVVVLALVVVLASLMLAHGTFLPLLSREVIGHRL